MARSDGFLEIVNGFKQLAEEMAGAGFEVESAFPKGASAAAIAKAQKVRGKTFPAPLAKLLAVSDGFVLRAKLGLPDRDGMADVQHEIWSTRTHAGAGDYKQFLWFEGDDEDEPRRNFVVVDMPQAEFCLGYVLAGKKVPADPKLTYHYCGEDLNETESTLEGYLAAALASARDKLERAVAARAAPAKGKTRSKKQPARAATPAERLEARRLELDKVFPGIDFQNVTDEGVIGHSNVFFDGKKRSLAPLDGLLFESMALSDLPDDVDLTALADQHKLERLNLRFLRGKKLPAALSKLPRGKLAAVTELDLELGHLDSLAFLAAFPALEKLQIDLERGSLPADLSRVAVRELSIRGPSRRSFTVPASIAVSPKLQELRLDSLALKAIPKLTGASGLTSLRLGSNEIARIENLDGLPALRSLDLYGNKIAKLAGIEATPALESLALGRNRLTALDGIGQLPALERLAVYENQIAELPPLDALTALTHLALYGNKLKALPRFTKNKQLETVEVYDNAIAELGWLDDLPKTCWVRMANNGIKPAAKKQLEARYKKGPRLQLTWN